MSALWLPHIDHCRRNVMLAREQVDQGHISEGRGLLEGALGEALLAARNGCEWGYEHAERYRLALNHLCPPDSDEA